MCVELPSPTIPPFSPKLLNKLNTLATNNLKKLLNSHTVVEALYTSQNPFDYHIKRGLQHQLMIMESGGSTSKVTGEC